MRLLSAIFETISDAVVVTDTKGVIVRANAALSAQTGYNSQELIGRKAGCFKSGRHDAVFYRQLWQSLREQGRWQGDIWNRHKNGGVYLSWLTIRAVLDKSAVVTHYLGVFTLADPLASNPVQARYQAISYDALTGLPNYLLFMEKLAANLALSKRHGSRFALLYLRLDGFRPVNQLLGYPVGDDLLKEVAERLQNRMREVDLITRLNGDEFLLVLTDIRDLGNISHVTRNLLRWLQMPFSIRSNTLTLAARIGIAVYPDDHNELPGLLAQAKEASLHTKRLQRGGFCFYNQQNELPSSAVSSASPDIETDHA